MSHFFTLKALLSLLQPNQSLQHFLTLSTSLITCLLTCQLLNLMLPPPIVPQTNDLSLPTNNQHTYNLLNFSDVGLIPINTTPDLSSSHSPISQNFPTTFKPAQPLPTRHSTRISYPPSYLADYHCLQTATTTSPTNSLSILYPLSSILSY